MDMSRSIIFHEWSEDKVAGISLIQKEVLFNFEIFCLVFDHTMLRGRLIILLGKLIIRQGEVFLKRWDAIFSLHNLSGTVFEG